MMKNKVINISLVFFYVISTFTIGFAIYLSGFLKPERLMSNLYKIERFGEENRYIIKITKDFNIKFEKIDTTKKAY